jgi:hypothetical protein
MPVLAPPPPAGIRADARSAGTTLLAGTLYFVDLRAVVEGLRKIGYGAAVLCRIAGARPGVHCGFRWHMISRQTGAPLRLRDTTLGLSGSDVRQRVLSAH